MMSAEREARDSRHAALADGLVQPLREALRQLPHTGCEEDENAMIDALVESLDDLGLALVNREAFANYLLSYAVSGDFSDWQEGHNHAMQEAARMVRDRWDVIAPVLPADRGTEGSDQ